jgi:hypothetical protein
MRTQRNPQPSIHLPLRIWGRTAAVLDAIYHAVVHWRQTIEAGLNWCFAVTLPRSRTRRWVFTLLAGSIWGLMAYWYQPFVLPPSGVPAISHWLAYPWKVMFAAVVLRKVILAGLAFWLAYRGAGLYLDDIFELEDLSAAQRYLRQAAFASRYDLMTIRDGDVSPEDKNSPTYRIGGPGRVQVYLENAALFEMTDGTTRVIGPTRSQSDEEPPPTRMATWLRAWTSQVKSLIPGQRATGTEDGEAILEGFERLRAVINLRDHQASLNVTERTRDGILVSLKDVQLMYNVNRGGKQATLEDPYPFEESAINKIVYQQMVPEEGHHGWLRAIEDQVRGHLGEFIARHPLSDFLIATSAADVEQVQEMETRLLEEVSQVVEVDLESEKDQQEESKQFISRTEIAQEIYDFTTQAANELGIQLGWVGLGTWVIPSEVVLRENLEALKISLDNQIRGSASALQDLKNTTRNGELVRMIRDVPLTLHHQLVSTDVPAEQSVLQLLEAYLEKLDAAVEIMRRSEEKPNEVVHSLLLAQRYLHLLCGREVLV